MRRQEGSAASRSPGADLVSGVATSVRLGGGLAPDAGRYTLGGARPDQLVRFR
ncbi:MAG: hypothetical protein ACRD29_08780 [Acidimicrobiales bacterium]